MIKALAWRIGCRLITWAVKREGATSVRIDAQYGETEADLWHRLMVDVARANSARWN